MSSFVLKTVLGKDVRRVTLTKKNGDADFDFDFKELRKTCRKQFKSVRKTKGSRFSYVDDEGDTITISTDADLAEAFRVAAQAKWKSLKIFVSTKDTEEKTPTSDSEVEPEEEEVKDNKPPKQAIHWGYTCDASDMSPIVGPRYHKRNSNFDLCEEEFNKLPEKERQEFEKIEPVRGRGRGRWWRAFREEQRDHDRPGWRCSGGGRWAGRRHHHRHHRHRHHHHPPPTPHHPFHMQWEGAPEFMRPFVRDAANKWNDAAKKFHEAVTGDRNATTDEQTHRDHHHNRRRCNVGPNFLFRKIKWCVRALKYDLDPLIEALKESGGAAAEFCEPLKDVIEAGRDKTVKRVFKRMQRSPSVQKFKAKLREIQSDIQQGVVSMCDIPRAILNSDEWAIVVAQLREELPKLAKNVEKIVALIPRLTNQVPSLMPHILPVLGMMAFSGPRRRGSPSGSDGEDKKNKKKCGGKKKKDESRHRARFVKDDNLPDGSVVESGKMYTKTWTIRNSGETTWPEDTALLHVGGDMELRPEKPRITVGAVPKGEERQVSVKLTAPDSVGRYWSYWRLVAGKQPRCHRFGLRVWADLSVKEADDDGAVKAEKEEEKTKVEEDAVDDDVVVPSTKDEEDDEEWEELPQVPADEKSSSDNNTGTQTTQTMLGTSAFVSKEKSEEVKNSTAPSNTTDLGPWKSAVEMLEAMGFNDPSKFQELLRRHNGDIQKIMNDILK